MTIFVEWCTRVIQFITVFSVLVSPSSEFPDFSLLSVGTAAHDSPAAKNFQLGTASTATVMILDDDHAGIFHFEGK